MNMVNLLNIFGRFNNEYFAYTLRPCPSSVTKSKKFTDCITHTINVKDRDDNKKKYVISLKIFLKINFFIEIKWFYTYIKFNLKYI